MTELRNRYFNALRYDRQCLPWEPPDIPEGTELPDPIYLGRVLAEMDRRLERGGLTFYATYDLDRLPKSGMDVVAILFWDEFTRIPSYFDRVRAIFRVHAVRPALTANVFRSPSWMNVGSLAAYLRTWACHYPGAARYRWHKRNGSWTAPIFRIPVGYGNQIDLPLKPLAERSTDVFFAGSVLHRPDDASAIRERIAPKTRARQDMIKAAEELAARHPHLAVEMVTTGQFVDSLAADAAEYSRRLMDSRIALVPRGTTPDTYRIWQALRYGCVPVVDSLPRHPQFYDDAPVVRVASWNELEDVVVPLLADGDRITQLHERALSWWRERGSEQAVGAYMADKLNALARDPRIRERGST